MRHNYDQIWMLSNNLNQVIICRYTLLRMRDFTATGTEQTHLVWLGGPDTIDRIQGTSPEEGVPQVKLPPTTRVGGFYLEYSCM